MRRILCLVIPALLAAACSQASLPGGGEVDSSQSETVAREIGRGEVGGDGGGGGGGEVHFVGPDLAGGDLLPDGWEIFELVVPDLAPVCDAPPYGFLCPCTSNVECQSGWCIDGSEGKICTQNCIEECPKGFDCSLLPGTCPDCQWVCVPQFLDLCRPCKSNMECQQGGLAADSFCLSQGAEGWFCGTACLNKHDCPTGYDCLEGITTSGTAMQCQPEDKTCACTPRFTNAQAATACFVQNGYGKCPGERYCSLSGLTECDAKEPVKELCDGQDNDCDGLFDEDQDICPGGKLCQCLGAACACVCGEGTKDCGGEKCVDPMTDVLHCGGCGKPCDAANVETYLCQGGQCKIAKCKPGFENINKEYGDGCECVIMPEVCDGVDNDCDGAIDEGSETCPGKGDCVGKCVEGVCICSAGCDLCGGMCVPWEAYFEDPENCGWCGNKCALPNTTAHGCLGGNCFPIQCQNGFADCDTQWPNGCEWVVEPELCNCVDDDCDGDYDEQPLADCLPPKLCKDCFCQCPVGEAGVMDCGDAGCINVFSDPAHCGWCGNSCAEMNWPGVKKYGCESGLCTILGCDNGFFDINKVEWDGCECAKTANVETCDFEDNNCNGQIDEAPLSDCPAPKVCSFGFCSCPLDQPNLQECLPNQCIDVFTNAKHCGFCGNDCAQLGWPNVLQYGCESGLCTILSCKAPWVDVNGIEFDGCECQKSSAMEACDQVDNNCNGQIDEVPNNCILPKVCLAGSCTCPPDQPHLQDCGVNNTCTDTNIDPNHCGFCNNKCALDNVAYQKCENGDCIVPGCKPGYKDCDVMPANGCEFKIEIEQCNGLDDNCDGQIDENPQGVNQPCDSGLPGICAAGLTKCLKGSLQCVANINAGQYPETCDGKDNDCNGMVDDGNPGGGGPCTMVDLKGECKTGKLECLNGKGTCIQTVFVQPESCDGKDNDCDGQSDGFSEPCFTQCGNGNKICNGGQWGACSAMEPKLCKNYNNCQMENMCLAQCPTAPAELCNNMDDNCDGKVDETFSCQIGTQKSQSCGLCGTQWATCSGNCSWGSWGDCQGQGSCSPGQTKNEGSCGNCGQAQYKCNNSCQWEYNSCINQGICSPSSTKLEGSCGNCGQQQYQCTQSCTWSYVTCANQGICQSGATKYEGSCGNCGSQKWTCSGSCNWAKSSCDSQGVCSPGDSKYEGSCGKCGKSKYTCSSSCAWAQQSGCYNEGVCSPGAKEACSGCQAKVCASNCTWGNCGGGNVCGSQGAGGCWCDSLCSASGDCCPGSGSGSACSVCGFGCNSCEVVTECGGSGGNCWCDSACVISNDCCNNARSSCGIQTCKNGCGVDFDSGCDCDWNCGWPTQGACCSDKGNLCG